GIGAGSGGIRSDGKVSVGETLTVGETISWGLNVLPSGTGAADQVMVAAGDGSISWANQAGGGDDGDWDSSGANLYLNSTYTSVGIGISAPTASLHVASGTNETFRVVPQAGYVSLYVNNTEVARMRQ
ncbi:MAG: hypothetical protein MJA29_13665, partial [Candidatus Omnitrophica bacterium]|nr:hypothetical protein [Candidatus Omnitrophota bacterium]